MLCLVVSLAACAPDEVTAPRPDPSPADEEAQGSAGGAPTIEPPPMWFCATGGSPAGWLLGPLAALWLRRR